MTRLKPRPSFIVTLGLCLWFFTCSNTTLIHHECKLSCQLKLNLSMQMLNELNYTAPLFRFNSLSIVPALISSALCSLDPSDHVEEMLKYLLDVDSDGNVMWLAPLVVDLACRFNVHYFPYDTQHCNLTLTSWLHHLGELDLVIKQRQGKV